MQLCSVIIFSTWKNIISVSTCVAEVMQ
jgi:hypothetical protein